MSQPLVLIYLLRRDLRLADNPIFHDISKLSQQSPKPFTHLLPVYLFPAHQVEVSGFLSSPDQRSPYPEARSQLGNFWRCGSHRAKFLAESVWDLKDDLKRVGSDLIIRVGMAGQVVKDLLDGFKRQSDVETIGVWMTAEEGVEEKREEREVRKAVEAEGKEFKLWIDEKYFIDDRDLPFDNPQDLPDVFTTFRKQVEPLRDGPRKVLPTPQQLPPLPPSIPPQATPFAIPETLDSIKSALLSPLERSPPLASPPPYPSGTQNSCPFRGGSSAAHNRLHHLLSSGAATSYKDTRNGLLGLDYSTKLSSWLALGSITARQIHQALLDFEDGRSPQYESAPGYGAGENKGTAAIRFELLWRDYMRLCTRKFGPRLFRLSGFRNDTSYRWKSAPSSSSSKPTAPDSSSDTTDVRTTLSRFLHGTTGTGLIDAAQRELLHTGYVSNRGRQNVASFLAKRLLVDWRVGAEWYESQLVDYDVSSNWGNWQYVAGVGNDPRGPAARVFNPVKQAADYDPRAAYVRAWIPELRALADPFAVFQPWTIPPADRLRLGLNALDWVNRPLVRIDFRPGGKGPPGGKRGGAGGGPGKYGGSSRNTDGGGEVGRGRSGGGGGRFGGGGSRGGGGGGGRGAWRRGGSSSSGGDASKHQGAMDKAREHETDIE